MAHKFSFDDALFALRMKPPAFRHWLQAGLVGDAGKDRDGWALEFSCHDLAVLALVRAMVDFGVPVATAHAFATRLMRQQAPGDDAPPETYWNVFAPDFQFQISRVLKGGKVGWVMATFEHTEAYVCGSAHLALFPRELIKGAIERAIEAAGTSSKAKRSA